MVHQVTLPNGDVAEFPDEMTQDQITSVLHKHFQTQNQIPGINKDNSILNRAANSQLVQNINNIGGGISHGLQEGVLGMFNLPTALMGKKPLLNPIKAPFADENSLFYKIPEILSQYSVPGGLSGKSVKTLGIASNPVMRNALIGALTGFFGTNEGIGGRSVAATVGAALPFAGKAGGFLKDVFFSPSKQELSKNVTEGLISKYLNNKEIAGKKYENIKEAAAKSGYSVETGNKELFPTLKNKVGADYDNPLSKFINQKESKFIDFTPTNDIKNSLNEILERDGVGKNLKTIIKNYKSNPSFGNASSLQTALRETAADFNAFNATADEKIFSGDLTRLRKNINSHIRKTFIDNGNKDIASMLDDASKFYFTHISPYQKVKPVWKAIRGDEYPANIANVLSRNSSERAVSGNPIPGNYETLRSHLSERPDLQKQLELLKNKAAYDAYKKNALTFGAGALGAGLGIEGLRHIL